MEMSLAIGSSEKYGLSTGVGIWGESWGLEIGALASSSKRQYPGWSKVEEAPLGLDAVLLLGSGSFRPYVGLGAYFSQETTLTPGPGSIVFEETKEHALGAFSFGAKYRGDGRVRNLTLGAGYHSIRGVNASLGYHW